MFKQSFITVAVILSLSACTKITTGEVGVVTTISGEIKAQEVGQGFHSSVFDSVHAYSVKQIPVQLNDLKPKAADNLRLQDFDVVVYYSVNSSSVAELAIKYSNASVEDKNSGAIFPAYSLVEQVARSAANESVAKFPSMQLNDKRAELEAEIKDRLQKEFDRTDKGAFVFERVNITNILTDASVEDSIRAVAASENKKKRALNELEVAKVEAETNRVKSQALDAKLLKQQELEVIGKAKFIIVPHNFQGIVNIPEQK